MCNILIAVTNTTSNRASHQTIKIHSGYKKRSKPPNLIYTDEQKNNSICGNYNLANSFAEQFLINHELSVNLNSDIDDEILQFSTIFGNIESVISFGEHIT